MTYSAWLFVTSITTKIRSRLQVGQVCPFNMLVTPFFAHPFMLDTFTISSMHCRLINTYCLCIALLVITVFSLSFIRIIFLLRIQPRGSLYFAVDVLAASTP
jgi:hypothetical protein